MYKFRNITDAERNRLTEFVNNPRGTFKSEFGFDMPRTNDNDFERTVRCAAENCLDGFMPVLDGQKIRDIIAMGYNDIACIYGLADIEYTEGW